MAANDILMGILEDYGLEDLYSFAQNLWVEGSTAADVLVQLRDQPKFKERFLAWINGRKWFACYFC